MDTTIALGTSKANTRYAAIIGFEDDPAEFLTLLLEILGWQTNLLTNPCDLSDSRARLIFLDATGMDLDELSAQLTINTHTIVFGIASAKAQKPGGLPRLPRVVWLSLPLDIRAVERVVEAAS